MSEVYLLLLCNIALLAVLLSIQPVYRMLGVGYAYALGNLDEDRDEGVLGRRIARAARNQVEALALITPVLTIAIHSDTSMSGLLLWTHIVTRVLYSVCVLLGIPFLRSTFWVISFGCWAGITWEVTSTIF